MASRTPFRRMSGFSMVEVLVTIVILTFGLLGLAGLQIRMQTAEMESYQRSQALVLVEDMAERLKLANPVTTVGFTSYVSATTFGTDDDSQPEDCKDAALGAPRDQCEWSYALKGSGEQLDGSNIGAMIGARGCIQEVQALNPTIGVCTPGIYRVTVAWQGLNATSAPPVTITCGKDEYGNENLRRVVSALVTIGLPGCST
jgi:type IV pilus assembly protein PilV